MNAVTSAGGLPSFGNAIFSASSLVTDKELAAAFTLVRAMPKNPAKIAMMLDPEYDDGGIPLFYTFVLDGLFERILPLLQPNFEACKLLSFCFFQKVQKRMETHQRHHQK